MLCVHPHPHNFSSPKTMGHHTMFIELGSFVLKSPLAPLPPWCLVSSSGNPSALPTQQGCPLWQCKPRRCLLSADPAAGLCCCTGTHLPWACNGVMTPCFSLIHFQRGWNLFSCSSVLVVCCAGAGTGQVPAQVAPAPERSWPRV